MGLVEKVYDLVDFSVENLSYQSNTIFQMDLLSIISESFAELVEHKDDNTGNHIKRVSIMTGIIAEGLKKSKSYESIITEDYVVLLRLSSPLHDIGKVAIPDEILLKKGSLTPSEYEVIKKHTVIGSKILENLHAKISYYGIEYFKMAATIALHHHEKWNGTGYPKGLVGEDIPLESQITAIVDVFDALMSKRPYKEAFSFDESLKIIEEDSGRHFNPIIVEALVNQRDEFNRVYKLLQD